MKIIFMGTPDFAVSIVDEIYRAGHEIVLVVTQPDKARGRSGKLVPSDVKAWALEHDIECFTPVKIRDNDSLEYLKKYRADIAVVAAFGQILPQEVLDLPKYGCINVHASILPKYRGAAPIQWSILDGEAKTGVTIMQMGPGLDDGNIISLAETEIGLKETGGQLFDRLADLGAKECIRTLSYIEDYCLQNNCDRVKSTPQNEAEATHVGMIKKDMGRIDFSKAAEVIERQIRALNPWPSAFTSYQGKNLKVWDADVVDSSDYPAMAEAKVGQVIEVSDSAIFVKCGRGILKINELQLEGKRRMLCSDFLKGRNIDVGDCLG